MEKEKKSKSTRSKTAEPAITATKTTTGKATRKTAAPAQPAETAEKVEPKKPAARKSAGPVAVASNATEVKRPITAKKNPAPATSRKISHEEIASLAHRYWAERGHEHGNHVDDWLRAERELRGKAS